jgi:uncharacterized protein (DUF488 family)
MKTLYTIGHSNHPIDKFLNLLNQHEITAICDVRSHPYSRYHPQFSYDALKSTLKAHNIAYVFLGKELGGKPDDLSCYHENQVQYARVAETQAFKRGIERLNKGIDTYHIALMCAEKEPLNCHRTILICRHLRAESLLIQHILEDGSLETQSTIEQRLIAMLQIPQMNLLNEQPIERAYDEQSQKIAYKNDRLNRSVQEEEENYEQDSSVHNRFYEQDCEDAF